MEAQAQQPTVCSSLAELQLRKELVRNAIIKDNADIAAKWKSLFSKPQQTVGKGKNFSMASLVNVGAGVFDGFMLAWKLYKKFHK